MPESPRWLLLQGRYEEAQTIIEKAAKVNGSFDGELKLEPQEAVVKPSRLNEFKLLISSWYLLRSTLIIWASWMCLSGAYYGNRYQIMILRFSNPENKVGFIFPMVILPKFHMEQ